MQHNIRKETWETQSLYFQMANIGSEVLRALQWRAKGNMPYAHAASERSLELFDLTLSCHKEFPRLKEIARARELWLDFFIGDNIYHQTEAQWKNYFFSFTYAAQVTKK